MFIKNYNHLIKILNHHYVESQFLISHLIKYCLHHQQLQSQYHLQRPSSPYPFIKVFDVMSMMLLLMLLPLGYVDAVGYSYTRFIGPVAGPEHKIYVNDADAVAVTDGKTPPYHVNVLPRLDYVAKPEYEFAYGVEDADAHILHNRNEMRDGDVVKGVYSLIDPDGALRVVKYTADEINGFQAEVIRNGVSSLHGQLQNDYNRVPPSEIINNNYYKPDHQQHHYPQSLTHTHEKGDTDNKYYPSPNTYTPNWEQVQKINHQQTYNPHIQYQTPPQPPIIYHYNNNNNDDGDDDVDDGSSNSSSSSSDSDSDYHDNQQQQQYEVHEKINNDNHDNNEEEDDEDDNDHIIDTQIVSHKKKKYHPKEIYDDENDNDDDNDDDDDDDDYNEENDSEEFEDYNETGHNAKNNKESDEYY